MATMAATMTTMMQTRITADGVELTDAKAETGHDYFERHPFIRALCPPWVVAYCD